MIRPPKYVQRYLPYFVFYVLLILFHGYIFGSNDQMDFMPYARQIQDAGLYPHDFYLQCIENKFNERWLIAHILAELPHATWPLSFLLLHGLCTILLLNGLLEWTKHFIKTPLLQWSVAFLTLIILYNRNLGGNELYYNMLSPSLISKSFAIWALWYGYTSKIGFAAVLSILATLIHPIAGAQIILLCFITIKGPFRWTYLVITMCGAGPYLYLLFMDLQVTVPGNLFVEIMRLRNAHHFFPASFGTINYVLLIPVFVFGVYRFYAIDRRVFYTLCFICTGCVFYCLMIPFLPKVALLSQWFKTTIWLKFFCVLAFVYWVESLIKGRFYVTYRPFILWIGSSVLGVFVFYKSIINYKLAAEIYQLPTLDKSVDIRISLQAKEISEPDDVFLVPPDFTAFKYYAERATYVDWKAIPHNGTCLPEWFDRIKRAYGLNERKGQSLSDLYTYANTYLSNMDSATRQTLKPKGIDYVIQRTISPDTYRIIKL